MWLYDSKYSCTLLHDLPALCLQLDGDEPVDDNHDSLAPSCCRAHMHDTRQTLFLLLLLMPMLLDCSFCSLSAAGW